MGKDIDNVVKYWIDKNDIITRTNFAFDDFAHNNNGKDIIGAKIIGSSLYKYIYGDPAKMFTRTIFDRVRLFEKDIQRDYRCDSPSIKRYMRMVIRPSDSSGLEVSHELIKEVKFERPIGFRVSGSGKFHKRCSMCNKIEYKQSWYEPDDKYLKNRLGSLNQVIYTICKSCQNSH